MMMRYDIDAICACEILEDRGNALSVFRLTRLSKDSAYKTIDFETTTLTASEYIWVCHRCSKSSGLCPKHVEPMSTRWRTTDI